MKGRRGQELLWVGLTGMLFIGTSFSIDLYQACYGDRNMWWTHQSMRLPLEKTRDNLEIYISDQLLQKRLAARSLCAVDNNGEQYIVVAEDISVRLNHWEQIKASLLLKTTLTGFALGIALALFLIGLFQYFSSAEADN